MKILYINTYDPYIEAHGGAAVTRIELELIATFFEVTTLFGEPLSKRKYRINFFRFFIDILMGSSIKKASYGILSQPTIFYKQFDLIFCNHDFSAYDYKKFIKIKKPFIVRKHNAEHKLFNQDRVLNRIERGKIKKFEEDLGRFSSATIHLSSTEFIEDNYSSSKHHLFPPLVPDALLEKPCYKEAYSHTDRPIDILCVTNYDWGPNKEGFDWFFNQVIPLLQLNLNIHLIGKGSERYADHPLVTSHGYVRDVSEFYKMAKIFIAPVLSGAGIKIKNLEAIIYGVPILTTPLGCDGLFDLSENMGATIAESPKQFARELESLLANEERCIVQRNNASNWVEKNILSTLQWSSRVRDLIGRVMNT